MLSRGRLVFLALSLATVVLLLAGTMLGQNASRRPDDGSDSLYKYLAVFTDVLALVNRAYVDETDTASLMAGAFEGVVDALDPFSLYVPAQQVGAYRAAAARSAGRSGLLVLKQRGVAYVVRVERGSPAARAGLEAGDFISQINDQRTRPMALYEIRSLLCGAAATKVRLEYIRLGRKREAELELTDYPRPGVELAPRDGVAVVHLGGFHPGTAGNVEVSLETVAAGSPELPEGTAKDRLVVDLRGLAGGEEAVAYRVAELFAAGELGFLIQRGAALKTFTATAEPRWQGRMVVLIDRATQGAAEILATVLRQKIGATLVGERSFGHAGRQKEIELSDGSLLVLTDAFYSGPDREPITDSLVPDEVVRRGFAPPDEEDEPARDEILERGLEILGQEAEETIEEELAA